MSQNFTGARRLGTVLAVGTVQAVLPLGTDLAWVASRPDVLLDNRGSSDAYIVFGAADATVTQAAGMRVPAGSMYIHDKGTATHIAVIGDAATTLVAHCGHGS